MMSTGATSTPHTAATRPPPCASQPYHKLPYRIVDYSSYSAGYRPELVLEDKPTDQASRWSSASNDQHQFLTLRLDQPSLLATITLGKFHKNHVCNLREFKVLVRSEDAGTSDGGRWTHVLHSGLRNDSEAETFPLVYPDWDSSRSLTSPAFIPVQFVRIVPLAAWGNSFNYSIWHVELRGIADPLVVAQVAGLYQKRVQHESWRMCLRFLRDQPSMQSVYQTLQERTGVVLEHPVVSNLYALLVEQGAFVPAESALATAHQQNPLLFREHLDEHVQYQPRWTRLDRLPATGPDGNTLPGQRAALPTMRGGHQMCWDPVARQIYLLGGWDGARDLADFWRYDAASNTWAVLSDDTRKEGGPGPRSCHKIVLHAARRRLYVFGRYVDTETRSTASLQSEFFYYDLDRNTWTCVAEDVHVQGGPALIYDHQMAVDEERDAIYVFGGRQITAQSSNAETLYSGLFVHDIACNSWRLVRADQDLRPGTPNIKSRIGHSMLFNPSTRQLFIYAGQRHKDYLCDFYVYDVDRDLVVELTKDTSKLGGPDAGFTQRSTLDVERQELFLFSGLMREKSGNSLPSTIVANNNGNNGQGAPAVVESARNSFWLYSLAKRTWTRLYAIEQMRPADTEQGIADAEGASASGGAEEPCPRFAHQLVYDPAARTHYLFGGNPGESSNPRRRLDDFWQLRLERPLNEQDILRRAMFLIRRQQFYEMCLSRRVRVAESAPSAAAAASPSMVNAMRFLQTDVAQTVNHADPAESQEFRQLSSWLLQTPVARVGLPDTDAAAAEAVHESRRRLFTEIIALFPKAMRPPAVGISELIELAT